MNYFYENDMFRLEGVSNQHTISDIDIYIGSGILGKAPQYIKKRSLGKRCLVISDNNTYRAAGEGLIDIFKKSGIEVEICMLPERDQEKIEADETAVGQVVMSLEPEPDFLAACGSGVINDIVRFVSHMTGKPYISVGTAASMDGYTSVIAPMIKDRKKIHRHGSAPKILILDTEVLRKAPYEMTVAGFGDVYGKYIAKADWLISNVINGEKVDDQALDLITQALDKLVENVEEIKHATDKGLKAVIEGLILAGLTIFTTGQTRAVASVEHNQSHIWETRMLEAGKPYASHGTTVGCSTGYFIRMYEYFKKTDISSLNKKEAGKRLIDYSDYRHQLVKCFGEQFIRVLEKENECLFLTEEEFEKQFDSITKNWDKILEVLEFLPSWEEYKRIYKRFGHTIFAEDIGIPSELLRYTLMYSAYYRDRYSFAYAMNLMGIAENVVRQTLMDYQEEKEALLSGL